MNIKILVSNLCATLIKWSQTFGRVLAIIIVAENANWLLLRMNAAFNEISGTILSGEVNRNLHSFCVSSVKNLTRSIFPTSKKNARNPFLGSVFFNESSNLIDDWQNLLYNEIKSVNEHERRSTMLIIRDFESSLHSKHYMAFFTNLI